MSDFVEQLSALALWFDDQNDMPRFKLVAEAAGHFRRLTERCDAYKEALEGMLRWFGKYPEFVPNNERIEECVRSIETAQAIVDGRRYLCERHGPVYGAHCAKCSETHTGIAALASPAGEQKDKTT